MEKMVNEIMKALLEVGFLPTLEWPLHVHLCFAPVKFFIAHEQYRGADHLRYQICVVRDEDTGVYRPGYYEATLVRPLEITPQADEGNRVAALNQQMQLVNWSALLEKGDTATVSDYADLKMVSEIVGALQVLEQDAEGSLYADMLRQRYWGRTQFEAYAKQGGTSRSVYEVSQRFHFFNDGQGITLDEAYRFLLHRWHEKRLHETRRTTRELATNKNKRSKKA